MLASTARVAIEVERVLADEVALEVGEAVHRVAGADADVTGVVVDPHDRGREVGARPRVPRGRERRIEREPVVADLDAGDDAHRARDRSAARSTRRACARRAAAARRRRRAGSCCGTSAGSPRRPSPRRAGRARARAREADGRRRQPDRPPGARRAGRGARRPSGRVQPPRTRTRPARRRRSSRARRPARSPPRRRAGRGASVPRAWPIEWAMPVPPPSMARPARQRRLLHGLARVEVVRLGDRDGKVLDAPAAAACSAGAGDERGAAPPAHGLDGVDERVEAGGRRDVGRHRHRRHRVEHDEVGQQLVAPRPHLAPVAIGQDARAGDLGAGAGGGGDGDDRAVAGQRVGAEHVVLDAHRRGRRRRPPAWRCRARCRRRRRSRSRPGIERTSPRRRRPTTRPARRRARRTARRARPGERRRRGRPRCRRRSRWRPPIRRRSSPPRSRPRSATKSATDSAPARADDHPRHPTAFVRCHARHGAIYGTPVPGTAVDRTAARR